MLNHVTLIGRLVADPESKQTPNGKSVCSIRIAVDRKGREKETDFFGTLCTDVKTLCLIKNLLKKLNLVQ